MRTPLAALTVAVLVVIAHPHATIAYGETFSVISYNAQFLPGFASAANKRKQPEYRAKRIAEEIAAYDIVALQEVFHDDHRPILLDALRDQWNGQLNVTISPKPEGFYANGGCAIATRYPIVETDAAVYTVFSKPEDYGLTADGHAAKGCIFARIELHDGKRLDVFATHLEARAGELRPAQYKELATFIRKTSDPELPLLLLGDLNTNGVEVFRDDPDSQYNLLLRELNEARPDNDLIDVWDHLHPNALGGTSDQESFDTGKRIDYVIVMNPPGIESPLAPDSVRIESYPDEAVDYLSDHNAVIADLAN